jgi:hypothetical protein
MMKRRLRRFGLLCAEETERIVQPREPEEKQQVNKTTEYIEQMLQYLALNNMASTLNGIVRSPRFHFMDTLEILHEMVVRGMIILLEYGKNVFLSHTKDIFQ